MKRCPTCQRTFDDHMKFCQSDGTPLVAADAPGAPAAEDDPFKTRVGMPPPQDEPEYDPMKTMVAAPPPDLPPPSPFDSPSSEAAPEPSNADLNAPSFGDLSAPAFGSSGDAPRMQDAPSGGFGQPSSDQFGGQGSSGGLGSSGPAYKEPESPFGQNFGNQPFGQTANEWSPPPAPTGWGNQGLGQNTPFSPPPAGMQGQNQTMGIISLVSGILSCLCCISIITGPVALILGYIQMGNIKKNPMMYGGKQLAMWGMITGGVGTAIGILAIILQVFFGVLSNIR